MIALKINDNSREVLAEIDKLTRTEMRRAISRAINHGIDGVEVEAKRGIRKIYKVKLSVLGKAFKKYKSSLQTLRATITASGRPLPVAGFSPRQTKPGVTVDVKGTRKLIRHTFMQTVKGALETEYKGVFVRTGKARYPIRSVTTVSVPGMFNNADVQVSLDAVAFNRFEDELDRQVRLVLSKR